MRNLRHLATAARFVAIVAVIAVVIKIAPTLASHAAVHSGTYGASVPAGGARSH